MSPPPLDHPADEDLHAYGLGRLDDARSAAVAGHLERCPDCRLRVAAAAPDSFLDRLRVARGASGHSRPAAPAPARAGGDTPPPELSEHPDYQVVRELGRGGMGVVYLAHNRLMGRDEVLKVIGRHILERPGVCDRFLREIRAVARLRHPNIVTAYAAFRLGDSLALAMEYVDGLDLARLVRTKGPLPVGHAAYFAHQAALGLQHAHEEGTVHRDIKPGNLMLARRKDRAVVKVLDFGLARAASEGPVEGALTHQGQLLGTPDYVAPEQTLDAQQADIRADVYSLGCTLYYLLTGGPPFRAASLYDLLQAHQSTEARPLNLARPEVPPELAAVVARMMAKDAARRYQEPGEVARALTPFFKKAAPVAPPPPRPSRAPAPVATQASTSLGAPCAPAAPPGPGGAEGGWSSLLEFQGTLHRDDAPAPADDPEPAAPAPRRRAGWRRPAVAIAGGIGVVAVACGLLAAGRGMGNREASAPVVEFPPRPEPAPAEPGAVPLFNGKDLAGWRGAASPGVFSWPEALAGVEDGELVIAADRPPGGIITCKGYHDYTLRFEYRIGEGEAGPPPKRWVLMGLRDWDATSLDDAISCRLTPGQAGTFCLPPALTSADGAMDGDDQVMPAKADAENPPGRWNDVAIRCAGPRVTVTLNGRVVNELECVAPVAGSIGLVTPRCEVRYRNLRLTPVDPDDTDGHTMSDPRSIVGRWHQWHEGGANGTYDLEPDGTIRVGPLKMGDWLQSGPNVVLRWPHPQAPTKGAWVLRARLADDGRSFEGRNQVNHLHRVERVEE